MFVSYIYIFYIFFESIDKLRKGLILSFLYFYVKSY